MKAFLAFLFLCFFSLSVSAQQFRRIFLFDDFVQAQIKFRNHSVSVVPLNYDASNKIMFFLWEGEMMEMINLVQVDTVIIGKRKFVPADRGFYEVIFMKEGVAYIDWLLKDVNIGSKGALGAVTQGSVKNLQMGDLGLNRTEMYTPYKRQKTGSTEVYGRRNDNTYYIKVKGNLEKVKSLKHLEEIGVFAKEHGTDMKEIRDALAILDYCMGLRP